MARTTKTRNTLIRTIIDFHVYDKVIVGPASDACNEFFIVYNSTIATRDHAFEPHQRYSRVDSRKHVFAKHIVQLWNQWRIQVLLMGVGQTFFQ
jgi:hypothetical protein